MTTHGSPTETRLRNVGLAAAWCIAAFAAGLVPDIAPWLVGLAMLASAWYVCREQFAPWQVVSAVTLALYMVLNRGFMSLTSRVAGPPVPIGHALMFLALALALPGRGALVRDFTRSPVVRMWMVLAGVALIRLVHDLPRHGGIAARDASFIAEACFMLIGHFWAREPSTRQIFPVVLAVLFLMNLLYALTMLWGRTLVAFSPVSGLFGAQVPVFGTYIGMAFMLVEGFFFYRLVAPHVLTWRRWTILTIALAQVGWSFAYQRRSMYIALVAGVILVAAWGPPRAASRIIVPGLLGAAALFVGVSTTGLSFRGRRSEVGFGFFRGQVVSLLPGSQAVGVGTVQWRVGVLKSLFDKWRATPSTMLFGLGFGPAITAVADPARPQVRTRAHNIHAALLARIGIVGLVPWVAFHIAIAATALRGLRRWDRGSRNHSIVLWYAVYYAITMFITTVDVGLELSYLAIPFYTITGYAVAFIDAASEDRE